MDKAGENEKSMAHLYKPSAFLFTSSRNPHKFVNIPLQ